MNACEEILIFYTQLGPKNFIQILDFKCGFKNIFAEFGDLSTETQNSRKFQK